MFKCAAFCLCISIAVSVGILLSILCEVPIQKEINQTILLNDLVKQGHGEWKADRDGKPTLHLFKIESGKVVN